MTGSELEVAETQVVSRQNVDLLPTFLNLADRIADTEFVPKSLRKRPAAVLACILYGHEVGMGPMQSLSAIDLIEGKPTVKPEAMRGLVRQAGHKFWVVERSDTAVTVAGCRSDDPDHSEQVTWTIDRAKRVGLAGKDVWKKYPEAMLLARATGELCRSMFSDVIAGLSYTSDEADDWTASAIPTSTVAVQDVRLAGEGDEEPLDEAFDREPIGVLLDALDDEGKSLAREAVKGRFPNWKSPNLTKTQALQYQDALRAVEAEMAERYDNRRKAVFAGLSEAGFTKDDDALRHAVISHATDGRTDSSAALRSEEVGAVLQVAAEVVAGKWTTSIDEDGVVALVAIEDSTEDPGRPFDEEPAL